MDKLHSYEILDYRRCPKMLWLNHDRYEAWLELGYEVVIEDEVEWDPVDYVDNHTALHNAAKRAFDPGGIGINIESVGTEEDCLHASGQALADGTRPVFYSSIATGDMSSCVQVMVPERLNGTLQWHAICLTPRTSIGGVERDKAAIISYLAHEIGLPLASISVVHINGDFIRDRSGCDDGLLIRVDLTKESESRRGEVVQWLSDARATICRKHEPFMETGDQCHAPDECRFIGYCDRNRPTPKFPFVQLPQSHPLRQAMIKEFEVNEPNEIAAELLDTITRRIKECVASGRPYFDVDSAAAEMAHYEYPARFLHFDAISLAIPYWRGTRPYQQVPYHFGMKILMTESQTTYRSYLNANPDDPFYDCARYLVRQCGTQGPIFVYQAQHVMQILQGLAEQCPELDGQLTSIQNRLVDLLPIARRHYYHPRQNRSWALGALLPAICPGAAYRELNVWHEDFFSPNHAIQRLIAGDAGQDEQAHLNHRLMAYGEVCAMALVRVWKALKEGNL